MKISEIIRQLLDVMDRIEADQTAQTHKNRADDNIARFNQVKELLPQGADMRAHANQPDEAYASVAAVTTDAGGGVNGPKHPSDIRAVNPSMYPSMQYQPGE